MRIEDHWKRIAGVYIESEGKIGAVWLALNPETDLLWCYDACLFSREVLPVIAEGLNARGRWIPIVWEEKAKDLADKLLDRGCNMLPEGEKDTDAMAEIVSREIWARMRTSRFKVDTRLSEWKAEFETFQNVDGKIPRESHPLMTATRLAVGGLDNAIRQRPYVRTKTPPQVAMI